MQQYMLHRLQEKHRLIIQLLLLICLFVKISFLEKLSLEQITLRFSASSLFIRRGQIFIVRQRKRAFFF